MKEELLDEILEDTELLVNVRFLEVGHTLTIVSGICSANYHLLSVSMPITNVNENKPPSIFCSEASTENLHMKSCN